ncbi:MAG: PEP-CTERM sorting domain-containing protein, partial [Verrucomicrobiae bacterium]|nr:PEP-CTERM sorting domain-containing protein [Verrucomicrobiae bacterium]
VSAGGVLGRNTASSQGNQVFIADSGSVWHASGGVFTVGEEGGNNTVTISNGGVLYSGAAYLGAVSPNRYAASNNTALVSGAGSLWTNSSLTVGHGGGNNTLILRDGGRVVSGSGTIGLNTGAASNLVLVSDSGSFWDIAGALAVGSNPNNSLIITNGGLVRNNSGRIGYGVGASNNVARVTGAGSTWSNTSALYIGYNGGSNLLWIANGGKVVSAGGTLGFNNAGSANNAVLVADSGSVWDAGNAAITLGSTSSGPGNSMTISNGGKVFSGGGTLGVTVGSSNNMARVTGSGSVWTNGGALTVGSASSFNSMTIADGGYVLNSSGTIGSSAGANNNTMLVTGSGTIWSNIGALVVGASGVSNLLQILDGAKVFSYGQGKVGVSSNHNTMVVAGPGSAWYDLDNQIFLGDQNNNRASFNQLIITNFGYVFATGGHVGRSSGGVSNAVLVASGGVWTNSGGVAIANGSSNTSFNSITIESGGQVLMGGAFTIGTSANGASNWLLVTGVGSLLRSTQYQMLLGDLSNSWNTATISNGGQLFAPGITVGKGLGSTNNAIFLTGHGSLLRTSALYVGTNSQGSGDGRVLVTDGGILESSTLLGGFNNSGTISNVGGVYRFTTASPDITPNTAGAITLSNGTVAFRGVNNAAVNGGIMNIAYSGANTLQLDSATNAATAWTFANGGAFTTLELVGTNARWQGSALQIGDGGTLRVSNTTASIGAVLTNAGTIQAIHAHVTYGSPVVLSGLYFSDPSTNTFVSNLTVAASGALQGSNGDLFVFQQNLLMGSTNRSQYDLSFATMRFTDAGGGPTNHVLDLTGSGALDLGSNWLNVAQLATNFSLGRLELGLGNRLQITGGLANAFYVGALDLGGLGTNALAGSLDLDVNLYYDPNLGENAFLAGQTYSFAGWNGSLTPLGIPIPEPTSFLAMGAGLMTLILLRRRSDKRSLAVSCEG